MAQLIEHIIHQTTHLLLVFVRPVARLVAVCADMCSVSVRAPSESNSRPCSGKSSEKRNPRMVSNRAIHTVNRSRPYFGVGSFLLTFGIMFQDLFEDLFRDPFPGPLQRHVPRLFPEPLQGRLQGPFSRTFTRTSAGNFSLFQDPFPEPFSRTFTVTSTGISSRTFTVTSTGISSRTFTGTSTGTFSGTLF